MLYPYKESNAKAMEWQRIMLPRPNRPFVFSCVPGGSYASVGEVYVCGYGTTLHGFSGVLLTSKETGAGTYDRLSAWKYAEWKYVEEG